MSKFLKTILLLPFATSLCAANLELPETFRLVAIDGRDVGGWFSNPREADLKPGAHKLAIEYKTAVEDSANPRMLEFINSKPVLVDLQIEENKKYRLVPDPLSDSDPRAFARDPAFLITDTTGNTASYEIRKSQKPKSEWAKLTALETEKRPARDPAISGDNESSVTAAELSRSDSVEIPASTGSQTPESPAGTMLIYWWNHASPETRAQFLRNIGR